MNTHYHLPKTENSAITVGSFDGVHLGHQKLLEFLDSESQKRSLTPYLITFSPHPRTILPNYQDFRLLTSENEKRELLAKTTLQNSVILPFDRDFSRKSADEFAKDLIQTMKPKLVIIGYDHKFGFDRKGSKETFFKIAQHLNWEMEVIEFREVKREDFKINSTLIRQALIDGAISYANALLGRNYTMCGTVVRGNRIGNTIGVPTANLMLDSPIKLIPKFGVYLSRSTVENQTYFSITNIGLKPTIGSETPSIETYIFDFDNDIYGLEFKLELLDYIRPEQKMKSLEALKTQIAKDIAKAKSMIHSG